MKKIVASAGAFFNEVRDDPSHPFRVEFDRLLLSMADRLGSDPLSAKRIDALKRDFLARPGLPSWRAGFGIAHRSLSAKEKKATPL